MNIINTIKGSVTYSLIALTVIIYWLSQAVFGVSLDDAKLFAWGNPEFGLWQLVSYLFLHGSLSHLLFNMFGLFSFGRVLEQTWGGKRFLVFYLVCGVGAALVHLGVSYYQFDLIYQQLLAAGLSELDIQQMLTTGRYYPDQIGPVSTQTVNEFYALHHTPAVGASGAIYGLLVAFALLFPNFKVMLIFLPVPIAAKYFVPVLLGIDLLFGVTSFSIFDFNIAHFAHLGGGLIGFLLVQFWLRKQRY